MHTGRSVGAPSLAGFEGRGPVYRGSVERDGWGVCDVMDGKRRGGRRVPGGRREKNELIVLT